MNSEICVIKRNIFTTWNDFNRALYKGVMMTLILHKKHACLNKFSQHGARWMRRGAVSLILHKLHIKPVVSGLGLLAAFYFRLFITIEERLFVYMFSFLSLASSCWAFLAEIHSLFLYVCAFLKQHRESRDEKIIRTKDRTTRRKVIKDWFIINDINN